MKQHQLLYTTGLALLTGLLLWMAWPPAQTAWVSFVAWVPLLYAFHLIELHSERKSARTFWCSFISIVVWNALTTYWIKNASVFGAVAACVIVNGLLMPLPLLLYRWLIQRVASSKHIWCFVAPWLVFEFFHLNWELAWPWLTLGNVFAEYPEWVQWYEYTGALGGSVWVLAVNYLLFSWLVSKANRNVRQKWIHALVTLLAVFLPLGWSAFTGQQFIKKQSAYTTDRATFVVVQPNHNPYNEKFIRTPEDLFNEMTAMGATQTDSLTDYLVFPETALTEGITENDNGISSGSIYRLRLWCDSMPRLHILSGADTYCTYEGDATPTARYSIRSGIWYDVFNAAVMINRTDSLQVYHKSKLVPGVERMPYPAVFGFLEDFAIDLGGTSGSLGSQEEASVLSGSYIVAPVICYESVFGNYVRDYVRKGAQLICIMTNDGWWGDTEGYRQHLAYASLRAIETRRSIARSANTGISCFIDATGKRLHETGWWQPAVIKTSLPIYSVQTLYVRWGDYIGWLAIIMCAGLAVSAAISQNKN